MRTTQQTRPRTILRAAAATAAGLAVAGTTSIALAADDSGQPGAPRASAAAAPAAISTCNGGAGKGLRTRLVTAPSVYYKTGTDGAEQPVPGTTFTLRGPRRGLDTFLITFSGEAQLEGGVPREDWMGLTARVGGRAIAPSNGSSDPLALTGAPSWNSQAVQFCVRLGPGRHRLRITTSLHDNGETTAMMGWLDDYTTSVQRFE